MSRRLAARGQPLVAFCVILMGWVTARALMVQATPLVPEREAVAATSAPAPTMAQQHPAVEIATPSHAAAPVPHDAPAYTPLSPRSIEPPPPYFAPPPQVLPTIAPAPPQPEPLASPAPLPVRVAAGHQLLWMAALSQLPLPAELTPPASLRAPLEPPNALPVVVSRWSGDAWLLYRRDSSSLSQGGFFPASYGASQTGAVLRYRLDRASGHRPAFYLRASSALQAPYGAEAALGFSLRPLHRLPIAALAEVRATRIAGGTRLRPAALVVTELPAFDLPAGLRGETYVQAGYVGGQGATAFVDGQLRAERRVASIGRAELRLGGGGWGGAQQGAARLDAGPSATLGLPLGGSASARVAMDWRFRIAGDAAPRSGPAITLSAGF